MNVLSLISESMLSYDKKRKDYDIILKQQSFVSIRHPQGYNTATSQAHHHPHLSSFTIAVYQMPRNLLIGCTIGIFAASFANYFLFDDTKKQQKTDLVKAWKNPKTGQ